MKEEGQEERKVSPRSTDTFTVKARVNECGDECGNTAARRIRHVSLMDFTVKERERNCFGSQVLNTHEHQHRGKTTPIPDKLEKEPRQSSR